MNSQDNRDRLAREVKAARLRKFKTVDRARIEAGVSRGTWDNVERGDSVKDFSLASIEEALDWPPGRALAILHGDLEPAGTRQPGRLAKLLEAYIDAHPDAAEADIAARVGVSRSTIGRWRAQALTELPKPEVLRQISQLTGVPLKDVFYAAGVDAGYIIEVPDDGNSESVAG